MHAEEDVWPEMALYVPAAHKTQAPADKYEPTGHEAVQAVEPGVEYVFTAHERQEEEDVEPILLL